MMSISDVGVVEPEVIPSAIVSQLEKCPEPIGNFARIEKARLLRKEQVAIPSQCARDHAVRQRLLRARIRDLKHQAQRRYGIERKRLVSRGIDSHNLLHVVEDITIEFELPSKGRELGKYRVTGSAGHARLARVARNRATRRGHCAKKRESQKCFASGPCFDRAQLSHDRFSQDRSALDLTATYSRESNLSVRTYAYRSSARCRGRPAEVP